MGCCKVGWKTKAEAEPWVEEHNDYYAGGIKNGTLRRAIGLEWCNECKEWHVKLEEKSLLKRFIDWICRPSIV